MKVSRRKLLASVVFAACISCNRGKNQQPAVVHVLYDAAGPFAKKIERTDAEFAMTRPHLSGGRVVAVASVIGVSYSEQLARFSEIPPEIVVLNSQTDIAAGSDVPSKLGRAERVCGGALAYIPKSVSDEERAAAELYLAFIQTHCK